jgi:hypothetical protein
MSTIELTDGTTTLDLAQGDLRLDSDGWGPAISRRRMSELGSTSPYDEVDELLRLVADGATPGAAWAELQRLLDQARRWELGDPSAAAVRLRVRPDCSNLAGGVVLETPLLRGSVGAYPGRWQRTLLSDVIGPIDAQVRRRGLWYNPTYESANSSSVTAQQLMTCTFASAQEHLCPVSLSLVQQTGLLGTFPVRGGLLLAPSASAFQIVAAESMTVAGYTSVADATCRGGAKLRYTATGTSEVRSARAAISNVREADIYIVATASQAIPPQPFRVRAVLYRNWYGSADLESGIYTNTVSIGGQNPGSSSYDIDSPALRYLGTVNIPDNMMIDSIKICITAPDASGSPTFDIDTIVLLAHDYGPTYPLIWSNGSVEGSPFSLGTSAAGTGLTAINVDQRPLATPTPRLYQAFASAPFASAVRAPREIVGDPAVHVSGATLVGWASLSAPNCYMDNGTQVGAAYTYQLQARRYPAALALE